MDEPTASLTSGEAEDLFRWSALKEDGRAIVYISLSLKNWKLISDRITVMRDGQFVATLNTEEASLDAIIQMMVGREGLRPNSHLLRIQAPS